MCIYMNQTFWLLMGQCMINEITLYQFLTWKISTIDLWTACDCSYILLIKFNTEYTRIVHNVLQDKAYT